MKNNEVWQRLDDEHILINGYLVDIPKIRYIVESTSWAGHDPRFAFLRLCELIKGDLEDDSIRDRIQLTLSSLSYYQGLPYVDDVVFLRSYKYGYKYYRSGNGYTVLYDKYGKVANYITETTNG